MSTEKERETIDFETTKLIAYTAKGNKDAEEYLNLVYRSVRVIDDVYDQDYKVTREDLLEVFEILFTRLPSNSFYLDYQSPLFSHHLSMWNAWSWSNVMEIKGDDTDKIYAHVLRDTCCEILPIVALITGGYNHMVRVSIEMRSLFKKPIGE